VGCFQLCVGSVRGGAWGRRSTTVG